MNLEKLIAEVEANRDKSAKMLSIENIGDGSYKSFEGGYLVAMSTMLDMLEDMQAKEKTSVTQGNVVAVSFDYKGIPLQVTGRYYGDDLEDWDIVADGDIYDIVSAEDSDAIREMALSVLGGTE